MIPVGEYLHTAYHPDCDYVGVEVQERNSGDRDHGSAQRETLLYLINRYPGLRKKSVSRDFEMPLSDVLE